MGYTESFRPAQIESICRLQNKGSKVCIRNIRKHCEKRRNCWLPAFSPFPTMFSEDLHVLCMTIPSSMAASRFKYNT